MELPGETDLFYPFFAGDRGREKGFEEHGLLDRS